MEQLDFTKWGVEKFSLYDEEGIAIFSFSDDEEYADLYNVAHDLLSSGEDYSVFHFSGKKFLFSKDDNNRLLVSLIADNAPVMKAVHFLPEMHKQICDTLDN